MLPSGISIRIREDLIDGISRTQTTLIIDPIITQGGHRVTMTDIGSIGYGKIDGGNIYFSSGIVAQNQNPYTQNRAGVTKSSGNQLQFISNVNIAALGFATIAVNDVFWFNDDYSIN